MVHSLNHQNFKSIIQNKGVALVDFYADWCGPCRTLAPVVDSVAQKFAGEAVVAKVNVDNNPELSQLLQVKSIPALFYFKDGQLVDKQVGLQSESSISHIISNLIKQP